MPFMPRKTYLDHNATTPLAREVRHAMARCLKRLHGNAASLHTFGRAARGAIDAARRPVASVLACSPDQVFFTSGGTEANNAVVKGVFAAAGKGHIVTSKIEHSSVLGACEQVEGRGGKVTYVPAGQNGCVRAEDVRAAIQPDTVLISIMHANNETGAIQPVEEISRTAREAGIPFHTDAVQSFGKIPTRVDELGCEFLTLSAHKINGPKGIGALYWRGNAKWTPLLYGGDQERGLRAGTEATHQIAGLGAATELAASRMEHELTRLDVLRERLIQGLRKAFPAVSINEAPAGRQLPGTVSATFPDLNGLHLLAGLDCYEVAVSIGAACTADRIEPSHVILGMGWSEQYALSTIRISMGTTTRAADVKYFLWALARALKGPPTGFAYLDPQHLTAERIRSDKTFLIDLRLPHERMLAASIPGARQWSHIAFERYFDRIPWDKEVVLMCSTGIFSLGAAYRLASAGHPSVRVVYGGYCAWRALYPDLLSQLQDAGP